MFYIYYESSLLISIAGCIGIIAGVFVALNNWRKEIKMKKLNRRLDELSAKANILLDQDNITAHSKCMEEYRYYYRILMDLRTPKSFKTRCVELKDKFLAFFHTDSE